jgi:hypothetical protein
MRKLVLIVIAVLLPLIPLALLLLNNTSPAHEAASRVEQLQPSSAAELKQLPNGQVVLIEGRISADIPAQFDSFVAYVSEVHFTDNDLMSDTWLGTEKKTPPLTIDLAGGLQVRVTNQNYALVNLPSVWLQPGNSGRSPTRYRGLEVGDQVTVIGVLINHGDRPQIVAGTVAGGTRAEYIASQNQPWAILVPLLLTSSLGLALFIGLAVALQRRDQRHSPLPV